MRPVVAAMLGFAAGLGCAAFVASLLADPAPSVASPLSPQREPQAALSSPDASALHPAPETPAPAARTLAPRAANAPGEVPAPQPAARPDGILVYGSVRDEAGQPIGDDEDYAEVQFIPAAGPTVWAAIRNGSYSRMDLAPGEWTAHTELTHYKPTSQPLTLTAEQPFVRLDIVVGGSHRVVVRAFTPDGRPLDKALAEGEDTADLTQSLGVIASLEPLASPPELRQRQWYEWGVGQFWLRGGIGAFFEGVSMPDDCLGLLEISVPSDAWAHLMLGSALLASQPVPADAAEVTFTIGPEQVAQGLGAFAVRCIDAKTRAPIEGADVLLHTHDSWSAPEHTGPDGRWRAERLTPRTYLFTANTKESEHLTLEVTIPPGRTVDVGDVVLHPAVQLSGTVVNEQGEGVTTSVRLKCLDLDGPLPMDVESGYQQTDAEGRFTYSGLGTRRYVLTVISEQLARRAVAVDLTSGDVTGLRIAVGPGVSVSVRPDWPAKEAHGLRIVDANGFTVGEAPTWNGGKPFERRLEAGRYTAEVFGEGGVERRRAFEVRDGDVVIELGS